MLHAMRMTNLLSFKVNFLVIPNKLIGCHHAVDKGLCIGLQVFLAVCNRDVTTAVTAMAAAAQHMTPEGIVSEFFAILSKHHLDITIEMTQIMFFENRSNLNHLNINSIKDVIRYLKTVKNIFGLSVTKNKRELIDDLVLAVDKLVGRVPIPTSAVSTSSSSSSNGNAKRSLHDSVTDGSSSSSSSSNSNSNNSNNNNTSSSSSNTDKIKSINLKTGPAQSTFDRKKRVLCTSAKKGVYEMLINIPGMKSSEILDEIERRGGGAIDVDEVLFSIVTSRERDLLQQAEKTKKARQASHTGGAPTIDSNGDNDNEQDVDEEEQQLIEEENKAIDAAILLSEGEREVIQSRKRLRIEQIR